MDFLARAEDGQTATVTLPGSDESNTRVSALGFALCGVVPCTCQAWANVLVPRIGGVGPMAGTADVDAIRMSASVGARMSCRGFIQFTQMVGIVLAGGVNDKAATLPRFGRRAARIPGTPRIMGDMVGTGPQRHSRHGSRRGSRSEPARHGIGDAATLTRPPAGGSRRCWVHRGVLFPCVPVNPCIVRRL